MQNLSLSPLKDQDELASPPQQGVNFRPLLRIARRKAWLIAGVTGLVTAAVYYFNPSPPFAYQGNFQLLVEPVTTEEKLTEPSTLTRTGGVPNQGLLELDYLTVIKILTSPGMLSDVVESVKSRYPNFNIEQLRDGLVVERVGGENRFDQTKIIAVSYQATDPELIQLVLEKTAQKYLKYSLEERKTRIGQGVEFIDEQLPQLQQRAATLQAERQKLREQNELIDPEAKGEALLAQIQSITVQQLETDRELQELRTLQENLQKQLKLTPDEAVRASTLLEDPNYQQLLSQLKQVESEIAVESARFQPANPIMQALEDKRQNLLNLLNQERRNILGADITAKVNDLPLNFQNSTILKMLQQLAEVTNQIQQLEVRYQALTKTKNNFEQQARQIPEVARRFAELQQELAISSQTLEKLLTQRDALQVEEAQKQVPWELVSDPHLLRDPAGDPMPVMGDSQSQKNLMMGVLGGLLLGTGIAFLLEKSSDVFYTRKELEEAIKLPLLGEIPWKNKFEQPLTVVPMETFNDSENSRITSPFLEAFDFLYANIRFRFSNPPVRSLVVCSGALGDGKSTIALHLAETAAAKGQKVLLVDANLRSPQLHDLLNIPNWKGLSNLLSSPLAPDEVIVRSPEQENCFVLTAGQPTSDSTSLLDSVQMQKLMKELQAAYDLVIYDTPDLLSFTDASYLAVRTDGILMVVGVGKTNQSVVQQALDRVSTFNLPILGLVANQLKKR